MIQNSLRILTLTKGDECSSVFMLLFCIVNVNFLMRGCLVMNIPMSIKVARLEFFVA